MSDMTPLSRSLLAGLLFALLVVLVHLPAAHAASTRPLAPPPVATAGPAQLATPTVDCIRVAP
jgi:hypothetical protein